ncbi:MAG: hypothetical protein WBA74_12770 [Cyclobacteriaceae bacterium]
MFGKLFKKTPQGPRLAYVTYQSKLIKYQQVTIAMQSIPLEKTLLVYFFEQTGNETEQLLQAAGVAYSRPAERENLSPGLNLLYVGDLSEKHENAESVYAMEIHPVYSINQSLAERFKDTGLEEITCYVGMDEPLMQIFGSERIIEVLQKLGLEENETLNHPMIDKSIERAQNKLDNHSARLQNITSSQNDWMKANNHLIK